MAKVQRQRIVQMLLKGNIYGLPGSDGTVRGDTIPVRNSGSSVLLAILVVLYRVPGTAFQYRDPHLIKADFFLVMQSVVLKEPRQHFTRPEYPAMP